MFISRVNGERAKGWQVRIERRTLTIRKFFSDSKYGSKAKAKRVAVQFRDKIVREKKVQLPAEGILVFDGGKPVWRKARRSDGVL